MELTYLLTDTRLAAEVAVEVLLKGSLLLSLTWLVMHLFRTRTAAERHTVWTVAFVLALGIPLGGGALPSVGVPLLEYPRSLLSSEPVAVPTPDARAPGPSLPDARPARGSTERWHLPTASAAQTRAAGEREVVEWSASPAGPVVSEATSETAGVPSFLSELGGLWDRFEAPLAVGFLLVWVAGVIAFVVRLLGHWVRVTVITARGRPAGPAERAARIVRDEARALGIRRSVLVVYSDRLDVPATWGALRPVLILPVEALRWSRKRLRAVILHELAHVRRWDFLSHQLAELARALYWANPLFWIAHGSAARARERACDREVLRRGVGSTEYASVLLDMARRYSSTRRRLEPERGLAMARPSGLRERISEILDHDAQRSTVRHLAPLVASLLVCLAALPVASVSLLASAPGTGSYAEVVSSLDHPSVGVRLRALRTLGGRCVGAGLEVMGEALHSDPDASVRISAATGLGEYGDARAIPALGAALHDEDELRRVRWSAMEALGRIDHRRSAEALLPYLEHEDAGFRWLAVRSLGKLTRQQGWVARSLAEVVLEDPDPRTREMAAIVLEKHDCENVVPWLRLALEDGSERVRSRAEAALARLGGAATGG